MILLKVLLWILIWKITIHYKRPEKLRWIYKVLLPFRSHITARKCRLFKGGPGKFGTTLLKTGYFTVKWPLIGKNSFLSPSCSLAVYIKFVGALFSQLTEPEENETVCIHRVLKILFNLLGKNSQTTVHLNKSSCQRNCISKLFFFGISKIQH